MTTQIKMPQPKDLLPSLADSSLKGAWLNKKTQGAEDYSTEGNDGTPTDVLFERVGGKFNSTSSSIDCNAVLLPTDGSAYTISVWVNANSVGSIDYVISQYQVGVAGRTIPIMNNNGNWVYWDIANGAGNSYGSVSIGTWEFFTFVNNGDGTGVLYFNGLPVDTVASIPNTMNKNTVIGGGWDVAGTTIDVGIFDGSIKDPRVYNGTKSADWILYEFQKGVPDASLILDVLDGTEDLSRFKYPFVVTGDAVVGKEMKLDGTGDYLNFSASLSAFDFNGTQDFAVSAYIKTTGKSTETIISKYGYTANDGWFFGINSNALMLTMGTNTSRAFSNETFTDDKWHHVMGVAEVGELMRLYADGEELTYSIQHVLAGVDAPSGIQMAIGRRWDTSAWDWDGKIKDVKVMTEAKSIGWVIDYYNRTHRFYAGK